MSTDTPKRIPREGKSPLQTVYITDLNELAEYVKDHARLHRQVAVKWFSDVSGWEVTVAGVTE